MHGADEIRKGLFSRTGYGIKYDLERMVKASTAIGNPQNSFRSFHIAGTNGKGSTCAYLEQCSEVAGIKQVLHITTYHTF
jgi:dihydrofolate synthase/folylpolyglutamate synthase